MSVICDNCNETVDLTIDGLCGNCKDINKTNKVKNPEANSRYGLWGDFETIDLIKSQLTKEEYIGALKFNILKYRLRNKGCDKEDQIKAADYQRELNELLNEN